MSGAAEHPAQTGKNKLKRVQFLAIVRHLNVFLNARKETSDCDDKKFIVWDCGDARWWPLVRANAGH